MRCEEIRKAIEGHSTQEVSTAVREHLAACPDCRGYARDWQLVSSGLRALAAEPVPEASLGFWARLVRRLEEARKAGEAQDEFVERAGRRVVFATLVLALTVLLTLVIPSAGPVRGTAVAAELFPTQADVASPDNDPIFAPVYHNTRSNVPSPSTQEVNKVKK